MVNRRSSGRRIDKDPSGSFLLRECGGARGRARTLTAINARLSDAGRVGTSIRLWSRFGEQQPDQCQAAKGDKCKTTACSAAAKND
jgi:hypothetical protein